MGCGLNKLCHSSTLTTTRLYSIPVSRVPVAGMDATDLGGEPSSMSKSYSVEDITAALDDMVSEDEFLNDTGLRFQMKSEPRVDIKSEGRAAGRSEGVGMSVSTSVKKVGSAGDELDALSKALQGFDSQAFDPTVGDEYV